MAWFIALVGRYPALVNRLRYAAATGAVAVHLVDEGGRLRVVLVRHDPEW